MTSVKALNPKAEVMGRLAALFMNINASKGLLDVMKTNLGPKGTIKMLVGGGGGAANDPHAHNHLARPLDAWPRRHSEPPTSCRGVSTPSSVLSSAAPCISLHWQCTASVLPRTGLAYITCMFC